MGFNKERWRKNLEFVKHYAWLAFVLVLFAKYSSGISYLASKFYAVCGQDFPLHAVNAIKIAYLKFNWADVIKLYGSLAYTPYVLELHYPPLAYLSSIFIYTLKLDPLGATVVANMEFLFLAIVALYFAVTRFTNNGFWGAVCSMALLATYLVRSDVFDIGWRIPALSVTAVGFFVYALIVEGRDKWWRWVIIGIVLGIAGLVHVLAFIPIFSLMLVEILSQSPSKKLTFKKALGKDIKFIGSRAVMALLPAVLIMATFYFPLLFITPEHFYREMTGEGVVIWSKVAKTLIFLPRDFADIFFDNLPFVFLIVLGLLALPFCSRLYRKLFFTTLLLIFSLVFGRTYNGSLYLIPYLSVILPVSTIGIWALAKKTGKIAYLIVGLAAAFIIAKPFNRTILINEFLENGVAGGFCADFGEIQDLSNALKTYSDTPQDKMAFVDCRKNIGWNGDVAIVAMALARTQDAMTLWPFVRQIFNNDPRIINLQKSDLICVIADELDPNGAPVCERESINAWADGVIKNFTLDAKYKMGEKWAVFYRGLPVQN